MNWITRGRIRWPRFPLALNWCKQLIRQETCIMAAADPFAADFLADMALIFLDPGLCEDCGTKRALELAYRYQPDGFECIDGIQN